MRRLISHITNLILKYFDLTIVKKSKLDALMWKNDALTALHEKRTQWIPRVSKYPAEVIVFSKDRALQLHALLGSYFEKVFSPVPIHVLYQTSSSEHQKAYQEVFELYSCYDTSAVRQKDDYSFRTDLIEMLESVHAGKIFFLVDDDLFIEDVDMYDFTKFDTDKFVPSLRMGLNLTRCYTKQQSQQLPEYVPDIMDKSDKISWEWNSGAYDWGYPLSVDGHLFATQEIIDISKIISFNSPNTFEANLQQFLRLFTCRLGVSCRKSRIVNIPYNKVQRDNENICGDIHQDELLDYWRNGLQLDYRELYGFMNESVHELIKIKLIKR